MAANTSQLFPLTADNQWPAAPLIAANTARDGTGTVTTIYTAPTDGGSVINIILQSWGSNPASVVRIFENNGSTNATPANNMLLREVSLPLTVASANTATKDGKVEIPMGMWLLAGHKLIATLGTAVADGWGVITIAQKFS